MTKLYKSYLFRTKDPVIDELRTLIEDATKAKIKHAALSKIERDGGPSASAMRGWFFGKVRRPQTSAVEAAGRAVGFQRVWKKM